ncbi:MAG: BglII/BstYI family type II restriction endonuclease [Candidatus Cloacimonas sp.]
MNFIYEYSYFGGLEILMVKYPEILGEVKEVIKAISPPQTKISKEKTRKSKSLFSPKDIYAQFKDKFQSLGYKELRDTFNIELPNYNTKIIRSYKQIDFCLGKVLIEVQFGKYPFMFYDLAKFQYFFNEHKADVGIEIVPCHQLHKLMSTGVSYGEQLINDVERLNRHFTAVPVAIYLIDI